MGQVKTSPNLLFLSICKHFSLINASWIVASFWLICHCSHCFYTRWDFQRLLFHYSPWCLHLWILKMNFDCSNLQVVPASIPWTGTHFPLSLGFWIKYILYFCNDLESIDLINSLIKFNFFRFVFVFFWFKNQIIWE